MAIDLLKEYPLEEYGPKVFFIMFDELFHPEISDKDLEFIELINEVDDQDHEFATKIKNMYLKYGMDQFMAVASKKMTYEEQMEFDKLYKELFPDSE